jgi:Holliday junction resolvase
MPNANRQRGDYFERVTKAALEGVGFWVVRAAGSLGVADVVALRHGGAPLLIACKTNGVLPRGERIALVEAAHKAGARPILATRTRRGWIDLYSADVHGCKPFGAPIRVPKRGAQVDDKEGDDDG